MKTKLLKCGICAWWYMPSAHRNHCPACSATPFSIHGKIIYINWQTERLMTNGAWYWSGLRQLINSAQKSE